MKKNEEETCEFEGVEVKRQTDKAFLIDFGDRTAWIPKSQIHDDSEIYDNGDGDFSLSGTLVIPEWLAVKAGVV